MPAMRCHYEVLGLDKDCDDSAIKKAYRKSALVWHPDKNQHRQEEAEERFKEICNAHEVLSDPHERAWYDSHREAILRSGERHQTGGGADFAGGHKPDTEADLFQFFSSSAFSGYSDGPKGFYTVYSNIFAKLAGQESEVDEKRTWPSFGLSGAEAPQVSSFYANWSSFTSCKTFSWADQYNPASAPNRQIRRRMEEENKKARKIARKEYNDTVRELVLFVKKRDMRLIAMQQAEVAKKAERDAAEAVRRKEEREARQRKVENYVEADWIRASEEAMESSSEEEASEEEEQEEFYCVACEKSFKSAKQLVNHERSKKHKQCLAELRAALEEEEELLAGLDGLGVSGDGVECEGDDAAAEEDAAEEEEGCAAAEEERRGEMPMRGETAESESESEEEEEDDEEEEDEEAVLARMMGMQSSSRAEAQSESEEEEDEEEEDEDAMLARMMGMQSSRAEAQSESEEEEEGEEEAKEDEGEEEEREEEGGDAGAAATDGAEACEENGREAEAGIDEEDRERDDMLAGMMANSCKPSSGWVRGTSEETASDSAALETNGPSAAAAPAARDEAQEAQEAKVSSGKGGKGKGAKGGKQGKGKQGRGNQAAPELSCKVCGASFESRSKLFKHISDSGHAALKR